MNDQRYRKKVPVTLDMLDKREAANGASFFIFVEEELEKIRIKLEASSDRPRSARSFAGPIDALSFLSREAVLGQGYLLGQDYDDKLARLREAKRIVRQALRERER